MARLSPPSPGSRDGGTLTASLMVLVIGPDPRRCGEVVGSLQRLGLPSVQACSAEEAMFWSEERPPSLVIIDQRMNRWRVVIANLRRTGCAVVALSDSVDERRAALESGCLDAVSPSIEAQELAFKARALSTERRTTSPFRGSAGPLEVDLVEGVMRWQGNAVTGSRQVLELAAVLVAQQGHLVPNRVILQELWGEPWAHPDLLHKAMWRLRRSLNLTPGSKFLTAKRGFGYGIFPEADVSAQATYRAVRAAN